MYYGMLAMERDLLLIADSYRIFLNRTELGSQTARYMMAVMESGRSSGDETIHREILILKCRIFPKRH
jgi:hypothetical protein